MITGKTETADMQTGVMMVYICRIGSANGLNSHNKRIVDAEMQDYKSYR